MDNKGQLIIKGWLESKRPNPKSSFILNSVLNTWIVSLPKNVPYPAFQWPNTDAISKNGGHMFHWLDTTDEWLCWLDSFCDKPNTNIYYIAHISDIHQSKEYQLIITTSNADIISRDKPKRKLPDHNQISTPYVLYIFDANSGNKLTYLNGMSIRVKQMQTFQRAIACANYLIFNATKT